MEEYHQITITEYLQWKQEIKDRLNGTVDNFIVIGYRLKQIRDNEAYRNDGYPSMGAFVQAEYGLNEATASKFMKINDVYSEGGNSMYLQEQYKNYGYNKLYEMIALPLEDRALITAETSVKEIREVKKFNREAEKAEKPAVDADEKKLLENLLMDHREAFGRIMQGQETEYMEDILYELAPSGSRMIRQGTLMLFLLSESEGVKIKRFGGNTEQKSYAEFFDWIREAFVGESIIEEDDDTDSEDFDVEKEEYIPTGTASLSAKLPESMENVVEKPKSVSEEPKNVSKQPESVSKPAENSQKPSEDTKKKRKSVIDISKIKDAEKLKNALQRETEEESSSPEPVEIVDDVMTRWDYLKTLSAIDAADYIQSYLDPEAIEDIRMLKNWLLAWVDGNGKS